MRKTTYRDWLHRCLASSLALGLGLGLVSLAPWQSRAAQLASTIKLDEVSLGHPILLDQSGQTIQLTTDQNQHSDAIPSYVAYQINGSNSLPNGFPKVVTESTSSNQTAADPLHLDALTKAELNQMLAKDGRAAVYTGQDTYLVKPIPPLFGTTGSLSGITLAWLASERSASSSSATQTSVPTAVAPIEAQTLIPTSITDSITDSKLVKDLEHLFTLKSGKLVNWNQQSLDALKSALKIDSPQNVAPKDLANTSKPELAAQVLDLKGSAGTPQPSPVPEPGPLAVYGLVVAALAVRHHRQAGRK